MSREIIVYSATWCGDCQKMKAFLDANNVDYTTRDIQENPAYKAELEEKTGKAGVPYLVIDGEWVRGYIVGTGFTEAHAREILGL